MTDDTSDPRGEAPAEYSGSPSWAELTQFQRNQIREKLGVPLDEEPEITEGKSRPGHRDANEPKLHFKESGMVAFGHEPEE